MSDIKFALIAIPAALLMAAHPFSRCAKPAATAAAAVAAANTANAPANTARKVNTTDKTADGATGDVTGSGWKSLFDGKTTKAWHTYGKAIAEPVWEVKDGALHVDNSKGKAADLVTDENFTNFDLRLEWKISAKGNSGIIFYVKEDTVKYSESYMTGLEMQVLDNDGHPDGKIHKHRAGDLYDLIASSSEPVKPVGEWNKAEIYSNNGELKLFLNGVNVVSTALWDDNWRKLVAGSKFKRWSDFGTFKTGKIDLQDHGDEVWFRDIKIKQL